MTHPETVSQPYHSPDIITTLIGCGDRNVFITIGQGEQEKFYFGKLAMIEFPLEENMPITVYIVGHPHPIHLWEEYSVVLI